MTKSARRRRTAKKAAKRTVKGSDGHFRAPLPTSHRRIHVAPPSSASEILASLSVSSSDLRAALDAIDS